MTARKKGRKKKVGRKWFDGKPEKMVVGKLREVWALDGSDEEACFYADISESSYYDYLKLHPELAEQKHRLKNKPVLAARQSVIKGMTDDPELALKYLSKKRNKEFSEKTETVHSGGVATVEISEKKYDDIIKREAKRIKTRRAK